MLETTDCDFGTEDKALAERTDRFLCYLEDARSKAKRLLAQIDEHLGAEPDRLDERTVDTAARLANRLYELGAWLEKQP